LKMHQTSRKFGDDANIIGNRIVPSNFSTNSSYCTREVGFPS
jgi:hypothetical protein